MADTVAKSPCIVCGIKFEIFESDMRRLRISHDVGPDPKAFVDKHMELSRAVIIDRLPDG